MSGLPPEREALAAELALGVLTGEDLRAAEELAAVDPAFASEVERWRGHFGAFDRSLPARPADPALWERIAARLEAPPDVSPAAAPAEATLETSRARELRDAGRLPISSGEAAADSRRRLFGWLWNNLAPLRVWALAATAAALVIAAGLSSQLQQARSAPVLVAILQTPDNRTAAVVNAFRDGRTELVPLASFTVPAGRVLEVWTLWDRQVGPRSIGLLPAMASARLRLDNLPLGQDQLFEITLEPAGGSPTGRPTGPILAIGRAARAI